MSYTIINWYWVIGGNPNPFSSAAAASVSATDATYLAWIAAGNTATAIIDWPHLYDVFNAGNQPNIAQQLGVAHVADLTGPQNFQVKILAGLPIISTATAALDATYPIDPATQSSYAQARAQIAGGGGIPGGGSTFAVADVLGTHHAFTSANFVNFADAASAYLQALLVAAPANTGWPSVPVTIA